MPRSPFSSNRHFKLHLQTKLRRAVSDDTLVEEAVSWDEQNDVQHTKARGAEEERREEEERTKTAATLKGTLSPRSPSPSSPSRPKLRTVWSEADIHHRPFLAPPIPLPASPVSQRVIPLSLSLAQRRGVGVGSIQIVRAERRKLELEVGTAKLVASPRLRSASVGTAGPGGRRTRSSSLLRSPANPNARERGHQSLCVQQGKGVV